VRTPTALVIALLTAVALGSPGVPKEGDRAPHFSIRSDQGRHVTPVAFGGKVLILNFWHTSCRPCVKELPSLSALAQAFKADGVVVLAVSGDEDAKQYQRFLQQHKVTLETYRDPSLQISKRYGTEMFPETYLIEDGRIVRKIVGPIDWGGSEITATIKNLLRH
jgi:cytochrome c biogenesis protein CcmG, thiol:disulfide interchange protein DsbE